MRRLWNTKNIKVSVSAHEILHAVVLTSEKMFMCRRTCYIREKKRRILQSDTIGLIQHT